MIGKILWFWSLNEVWKCWKNCVGCIQWPSLLFTGFTIEKHNKAYNLYSIYATLKKFIAKCCFTYKERVLFSCEASKWVVSRSSKLLQLLVSRSSPPLPTASRTTFSRSHPFKSYPVNYHRYRYMLTYSIKSFHSISYGWFPEGVFRIQIRIGSVWDSSGAGLGVRIRIGLQIEGGKIPPSSHI